MYIETGAAATSAAGDITISSGASTGGKPCGLFVPTFLYSNGAHFQLAAGGAVSVTTGSGVTSGAIAFSTSSSTGGNSGSVTLNTGKGRKKIVGAFTSFQLSF